MIISKRSIPHVVTVATILTCFLSIMCSRHVYGQPLTTATQTSQTVFEVASDGSRQYSTVPAAIAAAKDPNVRKVIYLYPGEYNLPDETGLVITTPNTHLIGMSRDSVQINASVNLGALEAATVAIQADNCSVENITLQNTAKTTHTPSNFKATALMVGMGPITSQPVNGFTANNVKIISRTDPTVNNGWGYDAVWIQHNAVDATLKNMEIFAYSDILSVDGSVFFTDSIIHVKHPTAGGYPFWITSTPGAMQKAHLILNNVTTFGVKPPFGYIVFGEQGHATVTMSNVNEMQEISHPPDYFITANSAKNHSNVLNIHGDVFGKMPAERMGVVVRYKPMY